ncbi:MAG: sensor domain-containing diguanylate cyclase [Limisphaerales bacterium]
MNKVFYELKFSGRLPSPAGVGMQILQLTQAEESGLDEIVKVVRSDPSLTGRILKVANAVTLTGAPPVTTIEEAVMRLGFELLRDLVLGFSLVSNNPRAVCRAFDYATFWHSSLGRAVAAQYLTELQGRGSSSESYVCGLLGGIGRLALAAAHPERYSRLLQGDGVDSPDALAAVESSAFGINNWELTEALLQDWGFPARLARAASTYQQTNGEESPSVEHLGQLRKILGLAERLAEAIDAGLVTFEALPDDLKAALVSVEIEEGQLRGALPAIEATWVEWGALMNVRPPVPTRSETARGPVSISGGAPVKMPTPMPATDLLLLEADDGVDRRIEGWLRPAGYPVVRVRSVREALNYVVAHSPQIVVAHGRSDDAEALELCKSLRKFGAGGLVFFLLATSNRDPRHLMAAFDAGADDYLVLPGSEGDALLRLRAAQRVLQLRAKVVAQERMLEQNLAELTVANRKLHRTAMTDELTQLPNRRFAEESLREEWQAAASRDLDLSLIVGDIDHFKRVNDTHGHLVGDVVLAAVARVFRQECRGSDLACRFGGEEFLVICPGTDLEGARRCAERLREKVEATELILGSMTYHATMSFGVASRRHGSSVTASAELLLKAADDASYKSKSGGRNQVSCACLG